MGENWAPAMGSRVLAFHPEARAWRPATVRGLTPDRVRVHFVGYAVDEGSGQAGGPSEYEVTPTEVEELESAADFFAERGEDDRAQAWRGILQTLAVVDPRVCGERRAARQFEGDALDPRDDYPLLVAAMLDADERIPGGAALFVRMHSTLADYRPESLASLGEKEIERAARVMPSPLRARVLITNGRRFLELARGHGGFRAWLAAQPDPVAALCQTFDRLESRAAVLFLKYLGVDAIAPDESLLRVSQRLGWVRRQPKPLGPEVRDVWLEVARRIGDRPGLLDLTVRRFADTICQTEPRCTTCAVPICPSRREESDLLLLEE